MYVKYKNRKIYSKETARYVTLDYLAKQVRSGFKVVVTDNVTKNDVTAECLAQYIGAKARDLNQVTQFIRGMK